MRFQLALLGLAAQTIQVLAVPAAEPRDGITAFDSVPTDKDFTPATAAGDDAVLPAACYLCGSPCGGYACCDPYPYCGYFTNPFQCVCYRLVA
ncbi:hypothetical protein DL771_007987 [Monosporascus sp. 5C6A]|nr:hypothetical protein DL771_007987 [Monosporascus sp. 5C6A]